VPYAKPYSIWLAWADNPVQERGKSSSSCARRGSQFR